MADSDKRQTDAGVLGDGYERLRAAVLAGSGGGWRLGHGVLSARGMTAWINAFGGLATPALASPRAAAGASSAAGSERSASQPVAVPHADQVVAVLTQMVLPLAA